MLACSCDIIQPCACPDTFSWSGATELLSDVMPTWLRWFAEWKCEEEKALAHAGGSSTFAPFNPNFPRIMPMMGMQVGARGRGPRAHWERVKQERFDDELGRESCACRTKDYLGGRHGGRRTTLNVNRHNSPICHVVACPLWDGHGWKACSIIDCVPYTWPPSM